MLEAWQLQAVRFLDAGGPVMWTLAGVSLVIWSGLLEHLLYLRDATPRLVGQARTLGHSPGGRRTEALRRMTLNRARTHLQRALPLLRTLVTLCPLLGLIGTVLGMIQVFDSIAILGTADPRALSAGISRAVLTTMGGLMIALPGLYLVNLVERRIARIMHRLTLESASTGEAQ
jgi:biopolymer transport protein ExbB